MMDFDDLMLGPMFFMLVDGEPIETDALGWARWKQAAGEEIRVAQDTIGDSWVSTVFTGMNNNPFPGPPVLWETMVFGGPIDQERRRYSSKEAALNGHAQIVALLTGAYI